MKTLRLALIVTALGLTSTGVLAFEQTQVGGSGSEAMSAGSSPAGAPPVSALNDTIGVPGVALGEPALKNESTGYEIRLPMIGVIGKLPKLDFGLELLYGADNDKLVEDELVIPQAVPDDGVTIRGSVKHRF